MTKADTDLDAVRALRRHLAEPSDEAVSRTRFRLTRAVAAGEAPSPRWRRARSWLTTAAGAAAALVVAVGVTVAVRPAAVPGRPGVNASVPAASAASSTPTTGVSLRPTRTALPLRSAGGPGDQATARALLVRLAAIPGPQPLAPTSSQLLYVHGASEDGTPTPDSYSHEMWVDVNGEIAIMVRRADGGVVSVNETPDGMRDEIAEQRAAFAQEGPSLQRPTPQFLAALPTDPAALATLLGSQLSRVFKDLSYLLYISEPLLTPQVRAALYRALARMDGVRSPGKPIVVNGGSVYPVYLRDQGSDLILLFDTATGRIVGQGYRPTSDAATTTYQAWEYAVVNKAGETPSR